MRLSAAFVCAMGAWGAWCGEPKELAALRERFERLEGLAKVMGMGKREAKKVLSNVET